MKAGARRHCKFPDMIEFPDIDTLKAWYDAPEYRPLIALRKQCTSDLDMMFTLEGA